MAAIFLVALSVSASTKVASGFPGRIKNPTSHLAHARGVFLTYRDASSRRVSTNSRGRTERNQPAFGPLSLPRNAR